MEEPKYRIMQRKDGVWCIYLYKYNVVIAEFVKGMKQSMKDIAEKLNAEIINPS